MMSLLSFLGFGRKNTNQALIRRPLRRKVSLQLEQLEDRTVPTLLGQQLFPADNPWNQMIANAPVAANSTAIVNNIVSRYGDGRLHPDFGQDYRNGNDLYGIPYNVVHGNSTPRVQVVIDAYPDESDIQMAPIPLNAVLEGDFQNGPRFGVDNRGDSHLIVWDQDTNIAYEFYRASRPSENADGKWHADQMTVWDMKTNTFRTLGYTSADAAGLAILPGLVRPDEALPVSQGGQGAINHAIRFTLRNDIILDQFIYPASHTANPGNSSVAVQPPMGARFRLKAGVDLSQFNPQARIVAQAMKDYGMILADNGSNFYFSGASYAVDANNQFTVTWNDSDIQSSLKGLKALKYSDFEVVDLTPVVTGLSSSSGEAGNTITVSGQNFSGAAGRLQVFFGNTPAASVSFVDDSHLLVGVPNGSGTVDVRVQSGVTTPANSDNIKSTVFGYGISAVTPAARFTFGVGVPTNQAPTVASAATASPNPVTGLTTTLNVLGADDGGAANLIYTWTVSGPASVSFSANGTNAARTTTATFTQPGTYSVVATIRDAGGLSVTSSVSVTVLAPNQAPTVAIAASASPNPVTGLTTTLNVLGADDGGAANLTYTWTATGPAPVTFSANGTNAARTTTATFTQPGTYSFVVTIRDAAGLSVTSSVSVTVLAPNQAPTVATPASASPNPVTRKTTTLSVLGADDGGAANLRYTWSVLSMPLGAAAPVFSRNGTKAAKSTVATFSKAGTYTFQVTITDAAGLSVTSKVTVTVVQKITSIKVTPATATVKVRETLQFVAVAYDQFGNPLAVQPTFTWSRNGKGSISSTGLYTAPRLPGGPYTIAASAGSVKGTAKVTVVM